MKETHTHQEQQNVGVRQTRLSIHLGKKKLEAKQVKGVLQTMSCLDDDGDERWQKMTKQNTKNLEPKDENRWFESTKRKKCEGLRSRDITFKL